MMKRELFFLLLLIVGVIFWVESKQFWQMPTLPEGFQDSAASDPAVNVPLAKPEPEYLVKGDPQGFAPPTASLLAPPPGQTASVNSYPATDPALQKVPLKALKSLRQTLAGFLAREAPGLEELGDPAIKLPMETARADLRRIDDEMTALQRNPGLESTLTQEDANQIEGNLAYLQKKWRLSVNNMPPPVEGFQVGPTGSMFDLGTGTTGSTGATGATGTTGATGATGAAATTASASASIVGIRLAIDYNTMVGQPGSAQEAAFKTTFIRDVATALGVSASRFEIAGLAPGSVVVTLNILPSSDPVAPSVVTLATNLLNQISTPTSALLTGGILTKNIDRTTLPTVSYSTGTAAPTFAAPAPTPGPGLAAGATGAAGSPGATGTTAKPASIFQLRDLVVRISAEIIRLQSSGTSDPIVTQRISVLESTRQSVNDIIRQVETGRMRESDIPITEAAYFAFLPVMTNINSPLPSLISKTGASSALNNLFNLYGAGDISGAALAGDLFNKYAGDFLKNLSWNVEFRYTGESERTIAKDLVKGLAQNQFGMNAPTGASELLDNVLPSSTMNETAAPVKSRGMFDSVIQALMGRGDGESGGGSGAGAAAEAGPPSKLDWKTRSQQICDQVKARGLNPYDFGCMKDPKAVSENFSYRGYAKMICSRLGTMYDPSIPTLCGCPPPAWEGWRG